MGSSINLNAEIEAMATRGAKAANETLAEYVARLVREDAGASAGGWQADEVLDFLRGMNPAPGLLAVEVLLTRWVLAGRQPDDLQKGLDALEAAGVLKDAGKSGIELTERGYRRLRQG